jgi:hypothetical protein
MIDKVIGKVNSLNLNLYNFDLMIKIFLIYRLLTSFLHLTSF